MWHWSKCTLHKWSHDPFKAGTCTIHSWGAGVMYMYNKHNNTNFNAPRSTSNDCCIHTVSSSGCVSPLKSCHSRHWKVGWSQGTPSLAGHTLYPHVQSSLPRSWATSHPIPEAEIKKTQSELQIVWDGKSLQAAVCEVILLNPLNKINGFLSGEGRG